MKKYIFLIISLLRLLTLTPLYALDDIDCGKNTTVITSPEYRGGLYGGFTWLYLKSMPTDGDLQTGTFLTLTTPPNLFARLQQLQSKPSNAFRVNLGYNIPCTSYNSDFTYFHYKGSDNGQIKNIKLNQFTQSFLGGAYSTLDSCEDQRINMANALIGKRFIIDQHLMLHPYFGLGYANVIRNLNVTFTGLIDAPPSVTSSTLNGLEKSKYWGLGPVFGSNFSFPIFNCFSLQGTFGGGVLLGNITSSIDAVEMNVENDMTITNTFIAGECNFRAMPYITSQLAFAFYRNNNCFDCEVKVGYEIDYFFNVIDRINPFDGFVINPNPFPVKQTSHLSLGGPFVKLSIWPSDNSYYNYCNCNNYCAHAGNYHCGFYGEYTSLWLDPVSNNDDLVFATLGTEKQQARFNYSWNQMVKLGYQTLNDLDFHATYFRFKDQSSARIMAENGVRINSVNASGNASVTYSEAKSEVEFKLNQVEFLTGKCFSPLCRLELLVSSGLRYASLKRTIQNQYTGGIPPLNFESKFNCLQSKFQGAGFVFAMQLDYALYKSLELTGYLSTSLLMGRMKSTLDQVNEGTLGNSSNTLRTPKTRWVVPIVDANAGLRYNACIYPEVNLQLEAGYRFSEYFKAINLVFPNFLTGLEQNNSDLKLHGPYLSIRFGF